MLNNPSLLDANYFYLPDAPEAPDLAVKWGGEDLCSPDYAIERRSYPFYVLELVVQGQGEFASGAQRVRLAAGSVYFFGPGVPHRYQCAGGHPLRKLFIVYGGTQAARISAQALGAGAGAFRVSDVAEVRELFQAVVQEGLSPSRYGPEICAARLQVLLYRLAALRLAEYEEKSGAYRTYQHATRYLHEHFERLSSVGELAAGAGVHESYLCRLYKKYAHATPLAVLTRLRMNKVANLLLTTHAPIKAIADMLGFTDQYVLSKVFKKAYGVSPSHYRLLNQPAAKMAGEGP